MRRLDGITDSMDLNLGKLWEMGGPVCCSPWDHKELDMTERLNNNNESSWVKINLNTHAHIHTDWFYLQAEVRSIFELPW